MGIKSSGKGVKNGCAGSDANGSAPKLGWMEDSGVIGGDPGIHRIHIDDTLTVWWRSRTVRIMRNLIGVAFLAIANLSFSLPPTTQFLALTPNGVDDTAAFQAAALALTDNSELRLLPHPNGLPFKITGRIEIKDDDQNGNSRDNLLIQGFNHQAEIEFIGFNRAQVGGGANWRSGFLITSCDNLVIRNVQVRTRLPAPTSNPNMLDANPLATEGVFAGISHTEYVVGSNTVRDYRCYVDLVNVLTTAGWSSTWTNHVVQIDAMIPFFGPSEDLAGCAFVPGIWWTDRIMGKYQWSAKRRLNPTTGKPELRIDLLGIRDSDWGVFDSLGEVAPHMAFIHLFHDMWRATAFTCKDCSNVLVENLTVRCMAAAIAADRTRGLEVRGLQVLPVNDKSLVGVTRGATNGLYGLRGSVSFVDCRIEGALDDALDITGHVWAYIDSLGGGFNIKTTNDSNDFAHTDPSSWGALDLTVGSEVRVYDTSLTELKAEYVISAPTAYTYVPGSNPPEIQSVTLTLSPVFVNASSPPQVGDPLDIPGYAPNHILFRNCTIIGGRGAGIITSGSSVAIENCTMQNTSGPGIRVHGVYSRNGNLERHAGVIYHTAITGNRVEGCNPFIGVAWNDLYAGHEFGWRIGDYWRNALGAIDVGYYWVATGSSNTPVRRVRAGEAVSDRSRRPIRDVLIRGNIIDRFDRAGISVGSAQGVTIEGNEFGAQYCRALDSRDNPLLRPGLPTYSSSDQEASLVVAAYCGNVRVIDNVLTSLPRDSQVDNIRTDTMQNMTISGNSW